MTCTGPSFEALFAVGAAGYAAEVPRADLVENGAILAIEREGEPLGIGGLGPAMVAYLAPSGPSSQR